MDGTGEFYVKQSKPGSKKSKVACFLLYVEATVIS
jgi:hypothetical protein